MTMRVSGSLRSLSKANLSSLHDELRRERDPSRKAALELELRAADDRHHRAFPSPPRRTDPMEAQKTEARDAAPHADDIRSVVAELLDAREAAARSFLDDIEKYEKVARTVCNTVALPEWIRGEKVDGQWRGRPPAEQEKIALSVILAGAELGLPPMVSLRHIFLVEGKVGLSAEIMLSLIIQAGVKVTWLAMTAEKATIRLQRPGKDPFEMSWTIEEAKKANLVGEKKVNWNRYPAAMLRARAISAAARAHCPDITNGCYSREEMEDLAAEMEPRPPTSLDEIASTASTVDDGPVAIKLIAKLKQVATQDEYKLVVQDANYLAHEMDDAEKQAVKLALEAAAARLKGTPPANG